MELLLKYLPWPAIVLLLAIFALLLFRKQIAGLIDRTQRVGKGGWVGEPLSSAKEQSKATPDPPAGVQAAARESRLSPPFNRMADAIRQELPQIDLTLEGQIDALVTRLAFVGFFFTCERVYNLIFGSQISLLKTANLQGEIPRDQIMAFYKGLQEKFPGFYQNRSVDDYLDFLVRFDLMKRTGNGVSITEEGTEFLLWMVRTKKSELRPW